MKKILFLFLFFFISSTSFSQLNNAEIAILIDDVGARTSSLNSFFEFNEKISFAILPFLAKSSECNILIHKNGFQSILHLPLESKANIKLNTNTKGMITTQMNREGIKILLDSALHNIGGKVSGFNNHMGSKFTSTAQSMYDLLELAKTRNLFFIDSNTYSKIGIDGEIQNPANAFSYLYAKALGVSTYYNSLFIDNSPEVEDIEKVLDYAIDLALLKGKILIIGHYRPNTAIALNHKKEKMINSGIHFVFASELLE